MNSYTNIPDSKFNLFPLPISVQVFTLDGMKKDLPLWARALSDSSRFHSMRALRRKRWLLVLLWTVWLAIYLYITTP